MYNGSLFLLFFIHDILSVYQLFDWYEVAMWAHITYLCNLGEFWRSNKQGFECQKVLKGLETNKQSFSDRNNLQQKQCNPDPCKTISLIGNSKLFSHYLYNSNHRLKKGHSSFRYHPCPALTYSTLISWFIGSGQRPTSFGKIVILSFPASAAYALLILLSTSASSLFLTWPGAVSPQLDIDLLVLALLTSYILFGTMASEPRRCLRTPNQKLNLFLALYSQMPNNFKERQVMSVYDRAPLWRMRLRYNHRQQW